MAFADKWARKAEITAIAIHWYMVHLFRFGGFSLTEKNATSVNWSGLQFQKTPWSWERTRVYRYYLVHIEIMMFYCYESSCSYHCFQCFALLLQYRVWWQDLALRFICKTTLTWEVFYPWEVFCEMMCVGRVEAVREEQTEEKTGSIKKKSLSSHCTVLLHHHCTPNLTAQHLRMTTTTNHGVNQRPKFCSWHVESLTLYKQRDL